MLGDARVREIIDPNFCDALTRIFDRMRVAEEEIAVAQKRWPTAARRLHAAWLDLRPAEWMGGSEEFYRRHCRELLARVKRGDDVAPGTDAEVCWVISQATLAAPPDRDHAAAYARAFVRVFPEHAHLTEGIGGETYPGRIDEIVERLRAKIGCASGRGK